jgi:hypothetical protein
MRGGLDDALDKLARRDELRRRAAGEAATTPPAVTELVEAIANVVSRNPKLEVTVGVEGAGDPILLHFAMEDGVVQVSADNPVPARAAAEPDPVTPRHADVVEVEVEEPYAPAPAYEARIDDQETRRISYDDRDRYDPGTGYSSAPEYATQARSDAFFADPPPSERRFESPGRYDDLGRATDPTAASRAFAEHAPPAFSEPASPTRSYGEQSSSSFTRPFSEDPSNEPTSPARPFTGSSTAASASASSGSSSASAFAEPETAMRSFTDSNGPAPHPFAATPPPPVPPQTTRRIHVEQHRAAEEPSAAQRYQADQIRRAEQQRQEDQQRHEEQQRFNEQQRQADQQRVPEQHQRVMGQSSAGRGMPEPLPEPIPLRIDSEETEVAAKRLAALLRDNPTLLRQAPPD